MDSWRSTVTGVVGAIAVLIGRFGLSLSAEEQLAIITLTVAIMGWFARDQKAHDKANGEQDKEKE